MKGRPPTPTTLLKARGSWRAKTRKGEPQAELACPEPPAMLQGVALAEWGRICPELLAMGILGRIDGYVLALWCLAWAEVVQATEELRGKKPWGKGMRGLISVRRQAIETLLKIAAQFGFTPAARARLQTEKPRDDGDPAEEFLSPKEN